VFTPDAPAVFRCLGVPKLKRVDARNDSMELLIGKFIILTLKKRYGMF
jgi:hypothetical protein